MMKRMDFDGDGSLSEQEFVDGAVLQVDRNEAKSKPSYQEELKERIGACVSRRDAPLYRMSSSY